jgi:DNA-binding SARP family transcriptional activator
VQGFPQTEEEPPDLAIYCLGVFRIYQHGRPIEQWNGLKGLSILKYLAAHRSVPASKEVLMDVFWPDADLEAARRNLHQAIYSLRQALRRHHPDIQHIRFENNQYLLNPKLTIWVDVEEFEERVQRGRSLEFAGMLDEALVEYGIADTLYQGAFLEEDLYEEWPSARREHLLNTYLEIADRVSKHYLEQGAYAAAIGLCQKLLGQDACYENAHRRLMRCYLAQGQRNLAIRQYQTCVRTLHDELEVPPSEETLALYEQLK